MIRLILVLVFVILYLILSAPLMVYTDALQNKDPKKADQLSLRIVQWSFKVILFLSGTKATVEGMENIPKDEGVLYVANHQGFFDTVLLYSLLPGPTGFVSKDDLLKVPLLRVWMKRLHCLFLKRNDARAGLQMILDAIEMIKSGISVFIFPEGTRNKGDVWQVAEFKAGAVKMAAKTGCPIIPIAVMGTREVLESHFPLIRGKKVKAVFGKPIYPNKLEGDDKRHLAAYAQGKVQEMLDEMKKSY